MDPQIPPSSRIRKNTQATKASIIAVPPPPHLLLPPLPPSRRHATAMLILSSASTHLLLPQTLTPRFLSLPLPSKPRLLPIPLAASSKPPPPPPQPRGRRRYSRGRSSPPPPTPSADATASTSGDGYDSDDDALEAAIYEFMRGSPKPHAFPTRDELLAAGRADLAAAVASRGGWLALGWSGDGGAADAVTAPTSGGVHPDYPPEGDASHRAPGEGPAAAWVDELEAEASSSGRLQETAETTEEASGAGLEGMLSRLERDRARSPPRRRGDDGVLTSQTDRDTPKISKTRNIHSSMSFHSQSGKLEDNNALSSTNDAWRTWSINKGGFSDFEAAEIHPTDSSKFSQHDDLDVALVEDDVHRLSKGAALNGSPRNGAETERDEIRSRLQNLELDLTSALNSLRSRFDSVSSEASNHNSANVLNWLSDDWEFEETKVMHALDDLRSIRAKIAVLEGKMALDIIEKQKIIEEKQRRLDAAEKALSMLRTVHIVWPSSASKVLLTGSFDGWTSQRNMERSAGGIFSLTLRLYPGKYEVKFIVDGVWRIDPLRPTAHNNGHENNLLIVT